MSDVAALYVDPRGPYPCLPGVDAWCEARDARNYAGPWAIVAHPPCGPWGNLRHLSHGAHADCGPIAVDQVRKYGGVLEHPARSKLWERCELPLPGAEHDRFGGYSIQVDQCAWGHVARKRTWLYIVGAPREMVLATVRTGGTPTHWVSGGRKRSRKGRGGVIPPGIKVCSANLRRRTPIAFAEWLIHIARSCHV